MKKPSKFAAEITDFGNYLAAERGLSKNTLQAYVRDITAFAESVSENNVEALTQADVENFLAQLKKSQFTSASIARKFAALRVFFRFLKREGYLSKNATERLDTPKKDQLLPEVLSLEEIHLLLERPDPCTPKGACFRAVFHLIYGSGLRVSELCSLDFYDVEEAFIRVRGKGGKDRVVPVNSQAIAVLDHYSTHFRGCILDKKAPLFINEKGKRLHRNEVLFAIKEYAFQAGIKRKISPHTLRHSFATHLLDNGADIRVIQELMGHADINSTDRYMHLSRKGIKDKFQACHPRN